MNDQSRRENRLSRIAAATALVKAIECARRKISPCAYGCGIPFFAADPGDDYALLMKENDVFHRICGTRAWTCKFCNCPVPTAPSHHLELRNRRACLYHVETKGVAQAKRETVKLITDLVAFELQAGTYHYQPLKQLARWRGWVESARARSQLIDLYERLCDLFHELGLHNLELTDVNSLAIAKFELIAERCLFTELKLKAETEARAIMERCLTLAYLKVPSPRIVETRV